jgi:hypothetical protein
VENQKPVQKIAKIGKFDHIRVKSLKRGREASPCQGRILHFEGGTPAMGGGGKGVIHGIH